MANHPNVLENIPKENLLDTDFLKLQRKVQQKLWAFNRTRYQIGSYTLLSHYLQYSQ